MLSLLLLPLLLAPLSAAQPTPPLPPGAVNLTYGELAQVILPYYWQYALDLFPSLIPAVMPSDVKPVRKAILAVRNALDVFSYAYATSDPSFSQDPLPYIRDLLDEGYTAIGARIVTFPWVDGMTGHFRDLQQSGVNYTQKSLISRRCEVLMWMADFEEKIVEHNITTYISSPNPTVLYLNRKESHLSSFFWKDTGVLPQATLTGLENVEALQRALLNGALMSFGALISLNNLTIGAQQTTMHDYRKQLRAITSVAAMVPLWPDTKNVSAALSTVGTAYDGLGDTEDRVSAYEYELKHGNAQSIAAAEAALDSTWLTLKAWLASGVLTTAESALLTLLIPYASM